MVRRAIPTLPATLATALTALSCGGRPGLDAEAPDGERRLPEQRVERLTIVGYDKEELQAAFERARSHLLMERFAEAAQELDQLRLLAEESELGPLATYHAGLAYEGLGDLERAIGRHREVGRDHRQAPIARHALIRLTRLLGALERWDELGDAADQLLDGSGELPVMVRIEALGAKALSLAEQGQLDAAERAVLRAEDLIEQHRFGQAGPPPMQLAQVAFARGEITRQRSEQIHLVPVPPNFAEVLEERCQGLLDAQQAYTEAMRSRDSHWSAMAGYRIGQLYQDLHEEAMRIPAPPNARTLRQQQLFEGAMRLRYRILLEKGLKMMVATVRMGERTGEGSLWITRARRAEAELRRALADEQAALDQLPYTEAELQAALDELEQRAAP